MIATPSLNMPSVPVLQTSSMFQPGSMSAGTPILLAPRLNQLTAVTSLPSSLPTGMLNGVGTPGLMSGPADASSPTAPTYMYQYMFEYSPTLEPSAAGKRLYLVRFVFAYYEMSI